MTILLPRRPLSRMSRRRFLATAAASTVSAIAVPYLSRAADRPLVTHGVASGDVGTEGGVVWARTDRPAQMLVEVSTTESFSTARKLPPIAGRSWPTCRKTCNAPARNSAPPEHCEKQRPVISSSHKLFRSV